MKSSAFLPNYNKYIAFIVTDNLHYFMLPTSAGSKIIKNIFEGQVSSVLMFDLKYWVANNIAVQIFFFIQ